MTSFDSIGNCSIDVNSDKQTLPPTHTPRSISDHTLRSASLLDDNNSNKINGQSPSLHVLKNGHRIPSYVGISCAISGYSNYNHYCSSLRNTCSRENSPNLRILNQEPVKNFNELRKNSLITDTLITSGRNQVGTNGGEEFVSLRHNSIKDGSINSETANNNNSLLQQRIASLYGETFATNWRESRRKNRSKLNNSPILDKIRSPSCPPTHKIDNNTHSKSLSVFENNSIPAEINEHQLESVNTESVSIEKLQMKPVTHEEVAVPSPQHVFIEDSFAQSRAAIERNGHWFLNELNQTRLGIQEQIDLTEEILERQQHLLSDDISGKLRAAVGKAYLLINQKFNQFKELCDKNISQNETEQFKTFNDDLEGFWDMVSIQVIDVKQTFNEINELRARGWNTDLPKKTILSPSKPRSRKSTPKGSPEKSSEESNDREIQRRNRLREAKRIAKQKAAKNEDEITIFIPSNSKQ